MALPWEIDLNGLCVRISLQPTAKYTGKHTQFLREDSSLRVRGNSLTSARESTGHREDEQTTKRCADEEVEPSLRENELPVREGEQQNVRNQRPRGQWGNRGREE